MSKPYSNHCDDQLLICNECHEAIESVGYEDEYVSQCSGCGLVEGETKLVTEAEYEEMHSNTQDPMDLAKEERINSDD